MYSEFVKIHLNNCKDLKICKGFFYITDFFWQVIKPFMANGIDNGAKLYMSDSKLFPDETLMQFQWQCLKFYQVATSYLLNNLPLNKPLVKHAQFLHHEKRNNAGSMSAISYLGSAATKVCHFNYANSKMLLWVHRAPCLFTFNSTLIFYRGTRIILMLETEWVNDDSFSILIYLGWYI